MSKQKDILLEVKGLGITFDTDAGPVRAVDDVSFDLLAGHTLGVAGESGCGKSVTALSIIRLLPKPVSRITNGEIRFKGQNLLDLPLTALHQVRGGNISMIFQEPMTALNPVHAVGRQLAEVYLLHEPGLSRGAIQEKCVDMLTLVGIPDPGRAMKKYPHQLSGGMRQRVMIAMALACEPEILIADEPTTALDVTVQAQILARIKALKEKLGMSVILITHDLGVIAENCDDVVVMYAGRVAEIAPVAALFASPRHPYTRGLLASIPARAKSAKTRLPTIQGTVPPLTEMPGGCRFAPRCPMAEPLCRNQVPKLSLKAGNHYAACHLV